MGLAGYTTINSLFFSGSGTPENTPITQVIVSRASISYPTSGDGFEVVDFNYVYTDEGNNFNITTDRYTAPVAGYYVVSGSVRYNDAVDGDIYYIRITVNAGERAWRSTHASSTNPITVSITEIVLLDAGDLLELRIDHDPTGVRNVQAGILGGTSLSIALMDS